MPYARDNRPGGNSGKRYAKKGFGKSFGPPRYGGGRDSAGPAIMHQAICSECNAECEVPFRPSGDKPVFCRDCFKKKGGESPRKTFGKKTFDKPSFYKPSVSTNGMTQEQFKILNAKLDKIIDVLESAQ